MSNLVERLRGGIILHQWVTMKNEAADEIERLTAYGEQLHASHERRGKIIDDMTLELRVARKLLEACSEGLQDYYSTFVNPGIHDQIDSFLKEKK